MDSNNRDLSSVQSVDRALTILDILKDNADGIGVTELSKRLGVAKSTIHRLLTSLQNKGFVTKNQKNDKYVLGLKLVELGSYVLQNIDIRAVAAEPLRELAHITGETAHLVSMDQGEIVYIDKVESNATIRMFSQIGKRAPVHCTGVGKAMLAYLPEKDVEDIINAKGMQKFTNNTLTTKEDLKSNLNFIKESGYSVDDEEHEVGIRCVAAPIFDHTGNTIAGISIAAPINRMYEDKLKSHVEIVKKYANEISIRLGYRK